MAEAGLLGEDDRLELVDGVIVEMAPIGNRHARCVRKLNELFHGALDRVQIDIQNPLAVTDEDEFYPDVVLLERLTGGYSKIPSVVEAILVIEVSDTTLEHDRRVKLPRYAEAGAKEVWIVDLPGSRVWVHRKPLDGDYGEVFEAASGDVLAVSGLPGMELRVDDILS